jgi:hypothetical protein
MKPSILVAGFLCLTQMGCSSDSSSNAGAGGASAGVAGTGSGTAGASAGAGDAAGGAGAPAAGSAGTGDAGAPAAGSAGTGDAGAPAAGSAGMTASAGAPANASADCIKYCTCHEANCASTAIPGGKSCYDFCATFTADQLGCRQNMCNLVPAQPDNDHCTHSVGVSQCL